MSKEIQELIEAQGRAFDAEKKANEKMRAEIEAKGHASEELQAELKRIETDTTAQFKSLQEALAKQSRPTLGDQKAEESEAVLEYRAAVLDHLKTGEVRSDMRELEKKALIGTSNPDGGYLIDDSWDAAIDRIAAASYVFPTLAGTQVIAGRTYKKRVKTRGVAARRLATDSQGGGETTAPQWATVSIDVDTLEAEPQVYNDTLEDAELNLEAELTEEAGIAFGEAEGNESLNGTGADGQMRGLLTYTAVANASYAWGSVGYIASGADGAFASSNPGDNIISLQHSLKPMYRNGAQLLMNDSTLAAVRKIKDGSGDFYLFNPDATGAFAGTVLGTPVVLDDYMPAVASDSLSIAYGNFAKAYKIIRRRGTAVIRDNLTTKGMTKFNFTRRNGGGMVNFEAVKLMKFATS